MKLNNINDLNNLKAETLQEIDVRFQGDVEQEIKKYHILICSGTGCLATKSQKILSKLEREIEKRNLEDKVKVFKTGCFGFCKIGPVLEIHPGKTFYIRVTEDDVDDIIDQHIQNNQLVERLLYKDRNQNIYKKLEEVSFFKQQHKIALRNCGVINPEDVKEYIALDGYQALGNILANKTPAEDIIKEITESGLRGRGGGGFLAGRKWGFAKAYENDQKYVVCNADEGDPGAFMDCSILEGDPHSVIESMIIAGYTINANQGYIYVRAEYPTAVHRLEIALKQAKEIGLLGKDILGSGFDFDLEIRLGAGAFVCGEETALIQSVMGMRGEPKPRPPFPAQSGLWGKPTLNNNVETYANISIILRKGANWYNQFGTEDSKGTKVFALAGKIRRTGLIEVPMGTTLRSVVYDIGGGIPNQKKLKAVQTGGPSGGCIPASLIDTPIEYQSLTKIGSMMGSGGVIIMDEDDCMVDIARFYLEFTQEESCGKCVPCRIGTKRLLEYLNKITRGQATEEDLQHMEDLCYDIKNASLCGLGQSAPNPILSTLKYFKEEYLAHVHDKKCPAHSCSALLEIVISEEKCIACGLCVRACPVSAISGERRKPPYLINQDLCIKCGACIPKCPVDAIAKQ